MPFKRFSIRSFSINQLFVFSISITKKAAAVLRDPAVFATLSPAPKRKKARCNHTIAARHFMPN